MAFCSFHSVALMSVFLSAYHQSRLWVPSSIWVVDQPPSDARQIARDRLRFPFRVGEGNCTRSQPRDHRFFPGPARNTNDSLLRFNVIQIIRRHPDFCRSGVFFLRFPGRDGHRIRIIFIDQ